MKKYLLYILAFALVTACETKRSGQVVIERPAPPTEVIIADSSAGVPILEPEELDEPEIPFNEAPDIIPPILPPSTLDGNIPQRVPVVVKPPVPSTGTVGTSINLVRLNNNLQAASKGDLYFKKVAKRAVDVGNDALKRPIESLTQKTFTNGLNIDKRYLLTFAPYWHKGANGVWYRIDGKGNGLSGKVGDTERLKNTTSTIFDLSLAYYASGNQVFADKAVAHVKAFLLDPKTGMLPSLEYAQLVPGNKDIRVESMVEAPGLVKVCDALIMLKGSKAYTPAIEQASKDWFASMLDWMVNSRIGKEADKRILGNIGTLYELQLASYASFAGNESFLKQRFERVKQRLNNELDTRGAFPEELKRHKANMYSNKALQAWVALAKVYNIRGLNLWEWEQNGKNLKKAGLFLVPYMMKEKKFVLKIVNGKPVYSEEEVQPNYALNTFRTLMFVYKDDTRAANEFRRFLIKFDTGFQQGSNTAALYEPFVKYW